MDFLGVSSGKDIQCQLFEEVTITFLGGMVGEEVVRMVTWVLVQCMK